MKLSINYSPQAAELLQAGQLRLDYLKLPPWPEMIAAAAPLAPVAVHYNLQAGRLGALDGVDWPLFERLRRETGTPYVNLHLSPRGVDYPELPLDDHQPQQYEPVIQKMIADVQAVCARFGPENVIVENIPYRAQPGDTLLPAVDPPAVRRVIDATGCGLLLDISHARIAAITLGLDPFEYMDALPVECLRELHFTGLHWHNQRWEDHLPVLDEDWPVLEKVLARIHSGHWARPWMLAFEYGGTGELFAWRSDKQVIASQMPRLWDMVHYI